MAPNYRTCYATTSVACVSQNVYRCSELLLFVIKLDHIFVWYAESVAFRICDAIQPGKPLHLIRTSHSRLCGASPANNARITINWGRLPFLVMSSVHGINVFYAGSTTRCRFAYSLYNGRLTLSLRCRSISCSAPIVQCAVRFPFP